MRRVHLFLMGETKHSGGSPQKPLNGRVREAVSAIEEDGAEVITFGCSATLNLNFKESPMARPFPDSKCHWDQKFF